MIQTIQRALRRGALASLTLAAMAVLSPQAFAAEQAVQIPPPALDQSAPGAAPGPAMETAVIAGGCFWGVQGVYQHVDGVSNAVSGYAGGAEETADYQKVGRGWTGHAETVQVTFDPAKISYGRILQIYFSVAHDPTQLNRQGPDRGTQYRSTVFPQNDEQASIAKAYIAQLDQAKLYSAKIVTTIEPGKGFYPAEDYHQDYLTRNPLQPYIVINDLPKIDQLKRLFPERYRAKPALVAEAIAAK